MAHALTPTEGVALRDEQDRLTLEGRCALYCRKRWDTLPDNVKRLLGLTEADRMHMQVIFERDYYREIARNAAAHSAKTNPAAEGV